MNEQEKSDRRLLNTVISYIGTKYKRRGKSIRKTSPTPAFHKLLSNFCVSC